MNATDELEKMMRDIQRKAYAEGWRAGLAAAQHCLEGITDIPEEVYAERDKKSADSPPQKG